MVEGGMTCVKYLLFAFNLLFFVVGLALIICGAVIQTSFSEYFDIIGGDFSSAAVLLIVVGAIIFIIGFFGCCGAVKENYCMVMTFAVLLCLIFILEITAGIVAFSMQANVETVVRTGLTMSLEKYATAEGTKKGWDALQMNLHCCGVNGTTDWDGKTGMANETYPPSCCRTQYAEDPKCGTDASLAYTHGCVPAMRDFITSNIVWIGVIGICLSFVQIVGVIFACCLAKTIKKEYEVVERRGGYHPRA